MPFIKGNRIGMAKEASIECGGVVIESLPNDQFRIRLDGTDHLIQAYIAGNMRKHQIRVLVGDRVTVEMTPYDMTKGRIRFRGIKTNPPHAARRPSKERANSKGHGKT